MPASFTAISDVKPLINPRALVEIDWLPDTPEVGARVPSSTGTKIGAASVL